jgi:Arc/MetJ-type ribon-helix-helix transcriptional regulator
MTPKISFRTSPELHDRMETEVEDSVHHENMSQFVRAAVREALNEDPGEFESSR